MEAQQIDEEEQYVESLSSAAQKVRVKDFVWSCDEWPAIKHNDFFDDSEDIPISPNMKICSSSFDINIEPSSNKLLPEELEPCIEKLGLIFSPTCRKMVAATQKWGFFKVIDHGVGGDILDDMSVCLNRFYDLPMEQKVRGARTGALPLGYSASNLDYGRNLPWAEILQLLQSPHQVLEFSTRVYGDQHQEFSNAMIRYMTAVEELGMTILEMLAHGLGLDRDFFTRCMGDKESTIIRVNRYPPCPLPDRCLGLGSHSDPDTLTILLQDEVGGLQVRKDDNQWFGIRPLPNSFVVNIGDTLEAWTNGRLKSVVHRAVVNTERSRLSVAYFISPRTSTLIEAPPELMDSDPKPRKYKSFTWGEFRNELLKQKRVVGKFALDRYRL